MLAIKSVLKKSDPVPTLVFDEIDAGISGQAAEKVSEALEKLSKDKQVICITHLPQIASKTNDSHYKIFKVDTEHRIIAKVEELDEDSKINEIARLLSNEEITSDSIKQASNMMKS